MNYWHNEAISLEKRGRQKKKSTRKLRHFFFVGNNNGNDVSSVQIFDFITSLSSSIFFLCYCTTSTGNNCVYSSLYFFVHVPGTVACLMCIIIIVEIFPLIHSFHLFFACKQVQQLPNVKKSGFKQIRKKSLKNDGNNKAHLLLKYVITIYLLVYGQL